MLRHPKDGRIHLSELKAMRKSPAHYRHAIQTCREVTRPMTVGAIADCMVFGNRGWVLYPGKVRNGKEWDAFRGEHEGMVIGIASEVEDARGAADAVLADPIATRLLNGCHFQRVMQWEEYGLPCAAGIAGERGGFDAYNDEAGYILDMKVTSSTEPEEFAAHAFRMHWHAQAAWYLDGARALGISVERFYLLGVESAPPHCVTVLEVSAEALEMGRKAIRMWVERLKQCEEADEWPGYTQAIAPLDVPKWAGLEGMEDV